MSTETWQRSCTSDQPAADCKNPRGTGGTLGPLLPKNRKVRIMSDTSNTIALMVFAVWILLITVIAVRFLRNKLAPVRRVKAVVVDKQKLETFSKYAGNGKRTKYVVVFSANDKKVSFYVSEFSYKGYRLNETGTLTYKGNRIIDFS